MNWSQQLTDSLLKNQSVQLAGMGTLVLKMKHAQVDNSSDTIVPPMWMLTFENNRGLRVENEFTALAQQLLQQLLSSGQASITGIGKWISEAGKITFYPETDNFSEGFFGFEEVKLKKRPKSSPETPKKKDSLLRIILWVFLVIIPICGILAFVIWQKDKLFGGKMVNEFSVKDPAHRIDEMENEKKTLPASADSIPVINDLQIEKTE